MGQIDYCCLCGNYFQTDVYENHLNLHFDSFIYKCGIIGCCSEFQSENQLNLHFSFKHKENKKVFYLIDSKEDENSEKTWTDLFKEDNMDTPIICDLDLSTDGKVHDPDVDGSMTGIDMSDSIKPKYCRTIKCLKCHETPFNKQFHVRQHLAHEGKIEWLYRCRMCPANIYVFQTMHFGYMKKHLIKHHNLKNSRVGKNYIDRSDQFFTIIDDAIDECFKGVKSMTITKSVDVDDRTSRNSQSSNKKEGRTKDISEVSKISPYTKCLECDRKIRNTRASLREHIGSHLRKSGRLKNLFTCMECKRRKTYCGFMKKSKIIQHLKIDHDIDIPSAAVHYLDDTDEFEELIRQKLKKNFNYIDTYVKKKCQQDKCEPEGIAAKPFRRCPKIKSNYYLPCAVCQTSVQNRLGRLKKHCLSHLRTEANFTWTFSCLICTHKVLRYDNIAQHCLVKHKIRNPLPSKHYVDKSLERDSVVFLLIKKCFPQSETLKQLK